MKEIHKRSLSGILFVIVLIGAILISPYTYGLLFFGLTLFLVREFYTLVSQAGYTPQVYPGLTIAAILFALTYLFALGKIGPLSFGAIVPVIFAIPIFELFRNKQNAIENIAVTVMGIIYVAVPFSLLNLLIISLPDSGSFYDPAILIILLVNIWACDSGAYLVGVRFGRHRLFKRISPKKSWEGFFGGLLFALISAWLLSLVFVEYQLLFLLVISIVTVLTGTLGDLVESMYKRQIGIKDSGKFMPGHGGLLDRFDSILMAIPFVYFVIQLFANFN